MGALAPQRVGTRVWVHGRLRRHLLRVGVEVRVRIRARARAGFSRRLADLARRHLGEATRAAYASHRSRAAVDLVRVRARARLRVRVRVRVRKPRSR